MGSRLSVIVVGWYNRFNVGDESYKTTFPTLFPHNLSFQDKGEADVCVLGGGDILSESYLKLALAVQAPKKYIFSASANRSTPLDLLNGFDQILVRDQRSSKLLDGIPHHLVPDAAFAMESQGTGKEWLKAKFKEEGLELYDKVVGVVLNAHLGRHSGDGLLARDFVTLVKAAQDIAVVADSTPASFVFFPMSTGAHYDDRATNGLIAGRCKFWKKNLNVYDRLTPQATLDLISACDAIISTRLHSSVFSVIGHRPFIDLVHHDKNRAFLESCGLEELGMSYWSFSSDQLKIRLQKMLQDSDSYSDRLGRIHIQQSQALREGLQHVSFD